MKEKMKENEKFKASCEKGGQDQQGFWLVSPAEVLPKSARVEVDCPESYDSSWDVEFRDGSRAYIGNPWQEVFAAWVDLR